MLNGSKLHGSQHSHESDEHDDEDELHVSDEVDVHVSDGVDVHGSYVVVHV